MNRRTHTSGWVLVETLVALVVLSIGVIAVNRATHEALVTRAQARDYTQARFLLEQLMSELELQPKFRQGASASGPFGDEFPRFTWEWTVAKVEMPEPEAPDRLPIGFMDHFQFPAAYLGKISATVRWTRAGRPFEMTAETLVGPDKLLAEEEDSLEIEQET